MVTQLNQRNCLQENLTNITTVTIYGKKAQNPQHNVENKVQELYDGLCVLDRSNNRSKRKQTTNPDYFLKKYFYL